MDRGTVLQALSSMEQYVVQLRQQDEAVKRRVNELQAEIQRLKQEHDRAQHIERDQNLSETDRMTARANIVRTNNAIHQAEQELRDREHQTVDLQSQIQMSQHITDELKTAEGYMHDYEQRAQRWVNEAYNMMR